jgi:hypothetical protein
MHESPYLEELRREVRAEARAEVLRESILSVGRQRFGKAATRKQRAQLGAITDLPHLRRIFDRLLDASSWANLLDTP